MKDIKGNASEKSFAAPRSSLVVKYVVKNKVSITSIVLSVTSIVVLLLLLIMVLVLLIQVVDLEQSERTSKSLKEASFQFEQKVLNDFHTQKRVLDSISSVLAKSSSCADIKKHNLTVPSSGYYMLNSESGQSVSMYCDMVKECGGITGGWMRVTNFDIGNCPEGFRTVYLAGSQKGCALQKVEPGCTSLFFSSFGIKYSQVCGIIRGYSTGEPDGFRYNINRDRVKLYDSFVDGIVLGKESSHIWTFTGVVCNCNRQFPFMKESYSCDNAGCNAAAEVCKRFLWSDSLCSKVLPWFYKKGLSFTSNPIRMNMCRDQSSLDEDLVIAHLELFVQ